MNSGSSYKIINAQAGTAVDLSGTDNKSIIGWPSHSGDNQKWTIDWIGNAWTFRNVRSGQYLGLGAASTDGTRLVAVDEPVGWHIWHDEEDPSTFRIFVPFTRYNLDLYNYGDPIAGDPITLWSKWNGRHQTWRFENV